MGTPERILIAEDSPTVAGMVRHALEGAGYAVVTAADGLAAMNVAFSEPVDLVISDVEMPEMTGLQLCRLLKGDPRTSRVPFLILSVHKEQYEQFWGRESGADDYLPKPFGAEKLLAHVRALLARFPQTGTMVVPADAPATTRVDALEAVTASLERRLFDLTVAHGISAIAATSSGERATANAVLDRVSRLIDFSVGALAFSPGGACFLLIRRGTHPGALQEFNAAVLATTAPGQAPVTPPSLLAGAEFVSERAPADTPAMVIQPLFAAEHLVGVLAVAREPARPFEDPERQLLQVTAGQAALVLDNARLQEAERAHAQALSQQNEELRRLNRTITDMISTVTHDLRTPLTSVQGYVELLLDEQPAEEQRDFLETIQRNADRMLRMINGLLEVTRLESRRAALRIQPTALQSALTEVRETLRPVFGARRQAYTEDVPAGIPLLNADPERLHQVLLNLLGNASKYTPEGGAIHLAARVEGGHLRVSIRDTGIGLSEEDLRQVFSKFFRARRPETADVTGTGLGLAIVRSIVELHGGEVFVESRLNQGSTFGFTMPSVRIAD